MPDASMDATLNAVVSAGFGAAGQKCIALATVVFVGGIHLWYTVSSRAYSMFLGFLKTR